MSCRTGVMIDSTALCSRSATAAAVRGGGGPAGGAGSTGAGMTDARAAARSAASAAVPAAEAGSKVVDSITMVRQSN